VGLDVSYLGITRFAIAQSDAVTAISGYLKRKTCEEFVIQNRIEVIHNFVNCDNYRRVTDRAVRGGFAAPEEKILVHLSNFRPVKRVTDVVEIFARVQERIPARLLLIGDGPERSAAEMLAQKKGVHDRTMFLGKQDDVEEILGIADVLLLPSELESFGLAALEGMACEVPPVATRVGGLPELVTHGVDGFLAEVGDLEAMTHYTVQLLEDAGLHQRFAQAARKTALTRFCSSLIIPRYEDLYRRVLERAS
jgi:N-acetyl-alpha-D-glucosaminyl L-malate synthase BshA